MKNISRLSQALKIMHNNCSTYSLNSNSILDDSFGSKKQYRIRIANNFELRKKAYRLLYRTYIEKEFASPNKSKMWYSDHDANDETITFVVEESHNVIAALTLVIDNKFGLPAEVVYLDEINALRNSGNILSEVTSLGIQSDLRGSQEILVKLFNYAYLAARGLYQSTEFIITVNPRHASFYTRKMLFDIVGKEKEYEKVGGAPAILLALEFSRAEFEVARLKEYHLGNKKGLYLGFCTVYESPDLVESIRKNIKPMSNNEKIFFKSKKSSKLTKVKN